MATHTTIEAGGREYRLSRFDPRLFGRFLDWANSVLPDPVEEAKEQIKGFPPDIQKELVRDALSRKMQRRSGQSPEIQALMQSPEGCMKALTFAFQKHHPELTEADVERLWNDCAEEHGQEYLLGKLQEITKGKADA